MNEPRQTDPWAEERLFGLPPGTCAMANRACDEFFRRRGMAVGNWRQRAEAEVRARAAKAKSADPLSPKPESVQPAPQIEMNDTADTNPPATEDTTLSEGDVFILIDVALAANGLVHAALAYDGKAPVTKAAVDLRAALRTAQAAGLIDPD